MLFPVNAFTTNFNLQISQSAGTSPIHGIPEGFIFRVGRVISASSIF